MQVVGYDTGAGEGPPAVVLATLEGPTRQPLAAGTDLAYALGERHCAGALEGETHDACSRPTAPYCDRHRRRWACARCTGDCDRPLAACRETHAVYLAAFAPATFKVGVTRDWRLETRLREQGADRAAHIRTVPDGRTARQIEADIAADVGDRVRVPEKIGGLHLSVDEGAWEGLLAGFDPIETYDFEYGLELTERPIAETLLTGTVRATKGRVLLIEHRDSVYAVDMRDLVGHELLEGGTDRRLQSSLGAFG